jgi:hypothetical protein
MLKRMQVAIEKRVPQNFSLHCDSLNELYPANSCARMAGFYNLTTVLLIWFSFHCFILCTGMSFLGSCHMIPQPFDKDNFCIVVYIGISPIALVWT